MATRYLFQRTATVQFNNTRRLLTAENFRNYLFAYDDLLIPALICDAHLSN